MTKEFQRETRYVVFKIKDLEAAGIAGAEREAFASICNQVNLARLRRDKDLLECVVVEKGWPEFELVWAMIKARMTGQQYALLLPPIADRFAELGRQRDALLTGVETATRILREIAEASDGDYEDVEELEALIAQVKDGVA